MKVTMTEGDLKVCSGDIGGGNPPPDVRFTKGRLLLALATGPNDVMAMDGWPRLALLTLATTGLLYHIWLFITHRGYLHHIHGYL